jgi:hypothetical protein
LGDFFFEGDLGFIYGERGLGKSWLGKYLARGTATREKVGPWDVHDPMNVGYVDGEMPFDMVVERLRSFGALPDNLHLLNHEYLYDEGEGEVVNLSDPTVQEILKAICLEKDIKVLILDNLSTLTSGVDENKGIDWEKIQPWLLDLRRHKISVIIIHHAGRSGQMRGHSKREDPAFWIIKLEASHSPGKNGAQFISRFTKNRNAFADSDAIDWWFQPQKNGQTLVTTRKADYFTLFLQQVGEGNDTARGIADELGVSPGYVSQLASRAEKQGAIQIEKRKYVLGAIRQKMANSKNSSKGHQE